MQGLGLTNAQAIYGVELLRITRESTDFDNLHKAFKLARRGKRWKPATARFEVNLLENLLRLSRNYRIRLMNFQSITLSKFMSQRNEMSCQTLFETRWCSIHYATMYSKSC